jgi:uncharacterized membrane protein YdjX (TVP38/TMEM64 family)
MPEKEHSHWRPFVLLVAIVVLLFIAKAIGLGSLIDRLRDWIEELGTMGIIVFVVAYILGVIAIIPGSALALLAGTLFGPVLGIALVSIGATIGAGIAFLIARYFARDSVSQILRKNGRFQKLDHLTESHGSVIVALTRLIPFSPFNVLNYAFGLTRVPFSTFMFWSWVCVLPTTTIYVLGVDTVKEALSQGRITWALVAYALFSILLVYILNRYTRRKLDEDSPI